MEQIERDFPLGIAKLFRHCLTTTYFQWQGEFFEQNDGVAMGSPLSTVIANYFMETFEVNALDTAPKKPKCWFRYVNDTFVVWTHGEDELQRFLVHLISLNPRIQFTMETEKEGRLPFLDVMVTGKPNGTLAHMVYRKQTHTDRYLNSGSNHHPSQKRGVIKTLSERARRIFGWNGYSRQQFNRATRLRNIELRRQQTGNVEENVAWTCLPYIHKVTERIGRILEKHKVKTTLV